MSDQFTCAVRGETRTLDHCETIHKNVMQGRAGRNEDKICTVAAICWNCPFRQAVKVGGIWSEPGVERKLPNGKMPEELVSMALLYTGPINRDFQVAGCDAEQAGEVQRHFAALKSSDNPAMQKAIAASPDAQRKAMADMRGKSQRKRKTAEAGAKSQSHKKAEKTVERERNMLDAENADTSATMQRLINERASEKPAHGQKGNPATETAENTETTVQQAPVKPETGKGSMAERARAMKARRSK